MLFWKHIFGRFSGGKVQSVSTPPIVQDYYNAGQELSKLGRWDEALQTYKSGLSLAPRDIELWRALLNAPKEANYDEPIKNLLADLSTEESNVAENCFIVALKQIDDTQRLAIQYIGLQFRDGDLVKLEAMLNRLQQEGHIDSGFLKSLSDYFWENGPADSSLVPSELYLKEHRHLHLLYRASEIYAVKGNNNERRIGYLEEVVKYEVTGAVDCLVIALAFIKLRRWEEATVVFEKGLNLWPDDTNLWRGYAESTIASQVVFNNCAKYMESQGSKCVEIIANLSPLSASYFLKYVSNVSKKIDPAQITDFIVNEILKEDLPTAVKRAELYIGSSAYCNASDFQDRFCKGIIEQWSSETGAEFIKAVFRLKLQRLFSRPLVFEKVIDDEAFVNDFCSECKMMMEQAIELDEPLVDLGGCTPWVPIYTRAVPHLYPKAALAIHDLSARVWPRLTWTAPHVSNRSRTNTVKIKVGFTCLDFMPMISGLMDRLNGEKFEKIFLRPSYPQPGGETARNWIARADRTINLPTDSVYEIQEAIATEELDIIVAGPSIPSGIYPMMARLAPIQITIIEPNWCDSFANVDYYISWASAEPVDHKKFHKNAVALMQHPPYWLEMPPQTKNTTPVAVKALAEAPVHKRVYVCPTSPVKLHPDFDEVLKSLLIRDPDGIIVFLRMDSPWAHSVQHRMIDSLGALAERLVFLPTLSSTEAHELLNAVDCVLDAYPLGGMSSSFVAAALGTPTVTMPVDMPFGKWMAAIYDHIGVEELTASTPEEYAEIAYKLASDKQWRETKASEIRAKRSPLIESESSAAEFEAFLLAAVKRHSEGLRPTDWVKDRWVDQAV